VGSLIRRSTFRPASLGRVLGGLALGVVEIGRHGDDGAKQVVVEGVFGTLAQAGQDLGRDLDRRLHPFARWSATMPGWSSKR
jgi:hypothetical protein